MNILKILQLVIAVALIGAILMQNRGGGLSNIFGGTGNVYMTKRGMEKKIFVLTIILAVIFFAISLLTIIL